jgi:hypothetical protein
MSASYIGSFLMGQQLTALQVALDAEKAKTATLETWASDRVKYAYPNGGSEGDERQLALSSVYHMNSPFGVGVSFTAYSEYLSTVTGEWEQLEKNLYGAVDDTFGLASYPRSNLGLLTLLTPNTGFGHPNTALMTGWEGFEIPVYNAFKIRIRCVRED